MNEKEAIKSMKEFAYTIHGTLSIKEAQIVLNLLEKKDKIIDEMAGKIYEEGEEGIVWNNKEEVKKYFERKIEKMSEDMIKDIENIKELFRIAAIDKENKTKVTLDSKACDTFLKYINEIEEKASMYDGLCD